VGEPIQDETFLILFNPHTEPIRFFMPPRQGTAWELEVDTAFPDKSDKSVIPSGEYYEMVPRSSAVLRELAD
jgi:glycogen operon protein